MIDVEELKYLSTFLDCADINSVIPIGGKKFQNVNTKYFNNAYPIEIADTIIDNMLGEKYQTGKIQKESLFVLPSKLRNSLDYSTLTYNEDKGCLYMNRHRQVNPKEVRGMISKTCQYMVEDTMFMLNTRNFEAKSLKVILGLLPIKTDFGITFKAIDIMQDTAAQTSEHNKELKSMAINIGASIAAQHAYESVTRISIGRYKNLKFTLPTDLEGIKNIFKLRDIPPGENRRKALLHWVGEHTRRKIKKDETIDIQSYLRGKLSFTWNDMYVSIKPAITDLDKLKNRERAEMLGG